MMRRLLLEASVKSLILQNIFHGTIMALQILSFTNRPIAMKYFHQMLHRLQTIPELESDQDRLEDLVTPLLVGLMAVLVLIALV